MASTLPPIRRRTYTGIGISQWLTRKAAYICAGASAFLFIRTLVVRHAYADQNISAAIGIACCFFLVALYLYCNSRQHVPEPDYYEFQNRQLRTVRSDNMLLFYAHDLLTAINLTSRTNVTSLLRNMQYKKDYVMVKTETFLTFKGVETLLASRMDRPSILLLRYIRQQYNAY